MEIISIGDRVFPGSYNLHSAFSKAANFLDGEQLVTIVTEEAGSGPVNLVAGGFEPAQASTLEIAGSSITLHGETVLLDQGKIYRSRIDSASIEPGRIEDSFAAFEKSLLELSSPKSLVFLLDPESDGFSILLARKPQDLDPEQRESVRAWADGEIEDAKKAHKDYKVRPDSWQERTLGGKPAVSFIADYVTMPHRKMVEYSVYVLGESTAAAFSTKVEAERFDDFKPKFDAVVDSFKTK